MKYIFLLSICLIAFSSANYAQKGKGKLTGADVRDIWEIPSFQSKKIQKETRKYVNNLIYLPSSSYTMGYTSEENLTYSKIFTIQAFYMGQTEVPNWLYREFCEEMTDSLGSDSTHLFLPDTLCWLEHEDLIPVWNYQDQWSLESMANFYFIHPAYDNYPVVGVSFMQAQLFCNWLTIKVKSGLMKSSKTAAWAEIIEFRLPSEIEWEYAARGNLELANYPWGNGFYQMDEEGKLVSHANSGAILDTNRITTVPADLDGHLLTSQVYSYQPNGFGLYNMSGNVSEWTDTRYDPFLYEQTYDLVPNYSALFAETPLDSTNVVIKGGSFNDFPYFLQSGVRRGVMAPTQSPTIGFRIVTSAYSRNGNRSEDL